MVLTHSKLGISKEVLATQVLPFLLPLCIEQSLSPSQYEALAALVGEMVNRVTSEHREALRQLDAVRKEAQQMDEALMQTTNSSSATNVLNEAFPRADLSSGSTSSTPIKDGKGLTLEEKHRYVFLHPEVSRQGYFFILLYFYNFIFSSFIIFKL